MDLKRDIPRLLLVLAIIAFGIVLIRTAWLCDDAYITFRTLENFLNGHGLCWNIAERVQSYTHPLWLLCLAPLNALTGDIYYTSLWFSIALSLLAVTLLVFRFVRRPLLAGAVILLLIFDKAFVDYCTSGLENPLTHLLLVVFGLYYFGREASYGTCWRLALIAGLLAVNRLDTLLLTLPPLLVAMRALPAGRALRAFALGMTPLVVWEVFSLPYYGFPFPNTAYAKLGTGIPAPELIAQSGRYLWRSAQADPLTGMVILAGLATPLWRRDRRTLPVVLGMLLYLLYIVRIGGDFMAGRLLTPLVICAVMLLARQERLARQRFALSAIAGILLIGLLSPQPPPFSGPDYGIELTEETAIHEDGIADERAFYYPHTGLLAAGQRPGRIDHPWANNGRRARLAGKTPLDKRTIGFFGFFAGPRIHIVDKFGLADPLLARLPARSDPDWRIGHPERELPEGYLESVAAGQNLILHPGLARYYEQLRLITRGRLFDPARLSAIVRMNLGLDNREKDAYLAAFADH